MDPWFAMLYPLVAGPILSLGWRIVTYDYDLAYKNWRYVTDPTVIERRRRAMGWAR